jgi:hypothetical protein
MQMQVDFLSHGDYFYNRITPEIWKGGDDKMNRVFRTLIKLFLRTPQGSRWITRRFTAGKTIEEGFARAKALREGGYKITLSWLGGEHLSDPNEIAAVINAHYRILNKIMEEKLDYEIAVKFSAWGLLREDLRARCWFRFRGWLKKAEGAGVFVWVDAEELAFRETTVGLVGKLSDFKNIGLCLQAYAEDSWEFWFTKVRPLGIPVRLCKGAYQKKDADRIIRNKKQLADRFVILFCLIERTASFEIRKQVAAHDAVLVDRILGKMTSRSFSSTEFGVLLGWHESLGLTGGYPVNVYTAFGDRNIDFLIRRAQEQFGKLFWRISSAFFV